MKCLSLWQPWASLVSWGEKRFETRSWSTEYTGEVAIHAAKRWTRDLIETCADEPFHGVIGRHTRLALPLGAVVAVATLAGTRRTEDVEHQLSDNELDFGDYTPGRFAWFLTDIRPLVEPYPLRARQGLFTLAPADITAIRARLARAGSETGEGT
jgi:hypothetical protein